MSQLNRNLLAELEKQVPRETLNMWTRNFNKEQQNDQKKINTPATNCTNTSWRKEGGNAIDKIKRKRKMQQEATEKEKEVVPTSQQEIKHEEAQENLSRVVMEKTLIKNKAVFFGDECELPYLHSSDAISHLYVRKSRENEGKEEILYNPAGSLDRSYMTSLKSLHIYHTNIESLRQLGTGWCNLKELSILYGKLIDLSGLSSFSSLEYLFLAFNQITSLSDLMFHPSIKCLDLQRNKIEKDEEIQYLATMDKLEIVNLNSNPVMKVKESRRIIQQKLGKKLDIEDYTRMVQYQLEEMARDHSILSYKDLEVSNYLMKICNEGLATDQISLENLYDSYQQVQVQAEAEQQPLDFVRYETKHSPQYFEDSHIDDLQEAEEEIFFTPLIHFLSGKKVYTSIITKYFENKVYLNMKKVESTAQSPAVSLSTIQSNQRLNKFSLSTKLEKEEACSLDKKECLTADLSSLDKAKRGRLSLGKTKKLLQRFDRPANPSPQLKFAQAFSATTNLSGAKTYTLKRSLLKKPSVGQVQLDMQRKFGKTASAKYE